MGERVMSVKWILREVLAQRGFTTASEISRIIQERTRYSISTQAVCDLLNGEPKMLRLQTAQAFCNAFGIRGNEFFEMVPDPPGKLEVTQSAGGEPIDITGAEVDFSSYFFAAGELCASKQTTVISEAGKSP
jgi:hypothetical protein